MVQFRGVGASRGIAIGRAHVLEVRVAIAERRVLRGDRQAELARLEEGAASAERQLDALLGRLVQANAVGGHDLVDLHRGILRSPELIGEARRLVSEECLSAEWAVSRALERIRSTFAQLDDPYFRDRGGDFEAAGERLIRALLGLPEVQLGDASAGAIAVGVDISALEVFQLRRAGITALVAETGGPTSHAVIVARSMGLPFVVGVRGLTNKVRAGATIIVDGSGGEIVVEPDEGVLRDFRARMEGGRERAKHDVATRAEPSITTDGMAIHLAANVEALEGVSRAVEAGAESIGLFRTEFLYLDRPDLPTEQEQLDDAAAALRGAEGRRVTFRTLDLGGDKLPLAVQIPAGPNPALGIRSARFSLQRPDILRRQLRALYRAARLGPLRFMFPLVSGVTELRQLRTICDDVRRELTDERVAFEPATDLGIMIETPSAALTADHLARRCDFLSLGTNDLIQYAFAADRENDEVTYLYQPLHPAVLRMLKTVIEAADAAETPLSLCGDMAGDPFLTQILIGLGLRELSMEPDRIPLVKAVVRGSSIAEAQALAREALALEDEAEITELVVRRLGGRFAAELQGFLPRA